MGRPGRFVPVPVVVGVVCAGATFAAVASLTGEGDPSRPPPTTAAPAKSSDGLRVFARMGCGNCHRLAAAGSSGEIGPNLDERLRSYTPEALRAKVIDPYPNSSPEDFKMMPEDFSERMSDAELAALVSFLLAAPVPAQR